MVTLLSELWKTIGFYCVVRTRYLPAVSCTYHSSTLKFLYPLLQEIFSKQNKPQPFLLNKTNIILNYHFLNGLSSYSSLMKNSMCSPTQCTRNASAGLRCA